MGKRAIGMEVFLKAMLMNEYRLRFVVVFCILFTFTARSSADLVVYTVPGSDLKIKLMGKVTVNVGATITLKSERGTLHFSLSDCQIVRAATNEQLHAKERAKAKREGTATRKGNETLS